MPRTTRDIGEVNTILAHTEYRKPRSETRRRSARQRRAGALLVALALIGGFLVLRGLPAGAERDTLIPCVVEVERGDTISKIAERRLGDKMRWPEIAALNPELADPNLIHVGQLLRWCEDTPPEAELTIAAEAPAFVDHDIPPVALQAYINGAIIANDERPECRTPWWLIAGVAKTESNHGRYGGRTLTESGVPDSPILGVPLDGRRLANGEGTAVIYDTDGGRLDGDAEFDRAVGPMQFIPSTWARWATDGNGDGTADPHNIHDAAAAAARYLCAVSGDLHTGEGLRDALWGYNRSHAYADLVLQRGHAYSMIPL